MPKQYRTWLNWETKNNKKVKNDEFIIIFKRRLWGNYSLDRSENCLALWIEMHFWRPLTISWYSVNKVPEFSVFIPIDVRYPPYLLMYRKYIVFLGLYGQSSYHLIWNHFEIQTGLKIYNWCLFSKGTVYVCNSFYWSQICWIVLDI